MSTTDQSPDTAAVAQLDTASPATSAPAATPTTHEPRTAPVTSAPAAGGAEVARSLTRLPEQAAIAAVKRFAPQAEVWAQEIRATYPTATPDALARLAQRRFTRKATLAGAMVSFANGWSAPADLAATGWANAELVAHIAAAYGKQATPEDILVLTGIHQDHESAAAAINQEPGHSASRAPITAASRTATWAALKLLARAWPGIALAGGAAAASLNSERVAARAIQRFRAS
ncbi:hypothetical protein [Asanoa siamensis]|uniref:hypothetical protein n=1 Tax=Asanoa siamensis TaxID=926357 RepID=UPI001942B82E|nr:hypothetical protein [Asanoa siamensis]